MSEPNDIAVISQRPAPYRQHVLRRLSRELEGARLHAIFTHEPTTSDRPWQSSDESDVPMIRFPQHELRAGRPFSLRARRMFKAVRDYLVQHHVRLIVLWGYNDLTRVKLIHWAHKAGVPLLVAGDSNVYSENRLGFVKRFIKRRVLRRVLRKAAGVMPVGTCGKAYFHLYTRPDTPQFLFPYEPDYNALMNVNADRVRQFMQQHELSTDRKRFLVCARLVPHKRIDAVIQAFKQISADHDDWDLLIAGTGPQLDRLGALCPPHLLDGGGIRFVGFLQFDDMAACYHACHVLVHASEFEPWGLVIAESVAAGLPVIATDTCGAAADLVQHRTNGLLVPPGNITALTEAMRQLTDNDVRNSMAQAAPQVLARWCRIADPVEGVRAAMKYFGLLT